MSVLDDIKGIVGEFRSGLAELAQQDQIRIAELQEMRRTIARQAGTLDEQVQLIARQRAELDKQEAEAATLRAQLDHAALVLGERLEAAISPAEHIRTLLGILDAVGGFMQPDYQDAIRAAREAVSDHG
jgi:Sec-independent protein translocase protein TatA